jgi:hypothetical protein
VTSLGDRYLIKLKGITPKRFVFVGNVGNVGNLPYTTIMQDLASNCDELNEPQVLFL